MPICRKTLARLQPTNSEIKNAQKKLGFAFSTEYIDFLKSGYDLNDIPMEALEIVNTASYLDIYQTLIDARKYHDLPVNLLPICEDNADYYCLNENGEVVFWSHNGTTDEKWLNVTAWRKQMIIENNED